MRRRASSPAAITRARDACFNESARRTLGYEAPDAIGHELAAVIVPPSLRDAHRQGLAHFLGTGEAPILGRRLELTAMRTLAPCLLRGFSSQEVRVGGILFQ